MHRAVPAVSLLIAAATLVAACSSGSEPSNSAKFNSAVTGVVRPSDGRGGTIHVGTTSNCTNWDPATTFGGTCFTLQREISRTLVNYGETGGDNKAGNGAELYGDLATSLGRANADKTEWTYTLRSGLRYSTGAPITSADVKYAFMRMFATSVITGGPESYFLCALDPCSKDGNPTYQGPYKQPTADLPSITTPDAHTVVFHLTHSVSYWDYLMALPAAAPVPRADDRGSQYGASRNFVESGPYVIASASSSRIVLTRNKYWSAASDPIRRALPDEFDITVLSNPDDLDARLKSGSLDLSLDGGVQATFQSQIINTPKLKANADNPVEPGLYMLILYPWGSALQNQHCRQAFAYALNKRDILVQAGGSYGGAYANTLLPPQIPGYDGTADAYPVGSDYTGDLTKARAELNQCGQPNGFGVRMAYSNYKWDPQLFASVQAAVGRVGIKVSGVQLDSSDQYAVVSTPTSVKRQHIDVSTMGWGADFPNGSGYLSLLVDGTTFTGTSSSANFVGLNDPTINSLVQQSRTATLAEQTEIFKKMDADTMSTGYYIPLISARYLLYRSPRLTNVDLTGDIGTYDLVNLGVSSGASSGAGKSGAGH